MPLWCVVVRVFFSELVNYEKRRETQRRRKIKYSGVDRKRGFSLGRDGLGVWV